MVTERHPPEPDLLPVAEIEVDSAEATRGGFILRGTGADSAEYRLEVHLDLPVDPKTQTVLGGILSQSEWRIWRRAGLDLPARRLGGRRQSRSV
jgi:hypothetical protein